MSSRGARLSHCLQSQCDNTLYVQLDQSVRGWDVVFSIYRIESTPPEERTVWAVPSGNTVPPCLIPHYLGLRRCTQITFYFVLSIQQSVCASVKAWWKCVILCEIESIPSRQRRDIPSRWCALITSLCLVSRWQHLTNTVWSESLWTDESGGLLWDKKHS